MSARLICLTLAALGGLTWTVPAEADWLGDICQCIIRDTKRRNCWPKPFVCPDREAVRTPLAQMVHNGWERQNLLAEHHFVDEGSELNEAGKLKVRWILTAAPRHHRTVYVHMSDDPETTLARIDHIQELATQIAPEQGLPHVVQTRTPFRGWSASYVDLIERKYAESVPDPRLPAATDAGTIQQ
jgi:hypothetical protein